MNSRLSAALISTLTLCAPLASTASAQGIPAPIITSITPAARTAGTFAFQLTVNGNYFYGSQSGAVSTVRWNGIGLKTNQISYFQLVADVPASLIATPGTASIDVEVTFVEGNPLDSLAVPLQLNPQPTITGAVLPNGFVGAPYSASATVSNGTPPFTWSVSTGTLNPGLVLNPNTGEITGAPTTAGSQTFILEAIDSSGAAAFGTFTLAVTTPLSISTQSLPPAIVNSPYSTTLTATGGISPYTWRLSTGQLPSGITLSSTGVISGTATTTGVFPITVQVVDSSKQVTNRALVLNVVQPVAITTASPLPDGKVGVTYSQQFAASGGLPPYGWSIASGSLPQGLSFSTNGLLSGAPSAPGNFNFAVRIADSGGTFISKAFSLTVQPGALQILTTSLPDGKAGTPYSASLEAAGGTPPYTWSIYSGSLPAGLTLTPEGQIQGTPTAAGNFAFNASVYDSASATAASTFRLNIAAPPPATVTISVPDGSNGPAKQPAVTVTLSAPYALPINGKLTLTFTPANSNIPDDPAVQFSSGGRTATFTIPAGQTNAVFTSPTLAVQTGTSAGRIVITSSYSSGGVDITPSPAPTQVIVIDPLPPTLTSVVVSQTSGGFNVVISGYSTPREVTQATFRFNPSSSGSLETTSLTVAAGSLFSTYYGTDASKAFGTAFTYTQPFTVSGPLTSIASVTVVLTNSQGTSQSVTASIQ